jgi:hypothetical protein
MNIKAPPRSEVPPGPEDSRLDRIVTYTTFHLGVYVTLAAAALAVSPEVLRVDEWRLNVSLLLFALAGAAGGTIASSAAEATTWSDLDSKEEASRLWTPNIQVQDAGQTRTRRLLGWSTHPGLAEDRQGSWVSVQPDPLQLTGQRAKSGRLTRSVQHALEADEVTVAVDDERTAPNRCLRRSRTSSGRSIESDDVVQSFQSRRQTWKSRQRSKVNH